jgi:hypothetical protein
MSGSGHLAWTCLTRPDKRTFSGARGVSVKCQKQTSSTTTITKTAATKLQKDILSLTRTLDMRGITVEHQHEYVRMGVFDL